MSESHNLLPLLTPEEETETLEVEEPWAGERLDIFVAQGAQISRAQAKKWIEGGRVWGGEGLWLSPSRRLRLGESVSFSPPPLMSALPQAQPELLPLDILYEDSDLLVLNKPRGLVVHPGAGVQQGTLVNALLAHCQDLSGIGGVERPGIVHRLDKDTSGLMVVSKNDAVHLELSRQFAQREVHKLYQALVWGVPQPPCGLIEQSIGRHPQERKLMAVRPKGREAKTTYKVLEAYGDRYAWLELHLYTGRTHQIRVHLSWLGYPLVGDPLYKPRPNPWQLAGQALHCAQLAFTHPRSGQKLEFEAPAPEILQNILRQLRESY